MGFFVNDILNICKASWVTVEFISDKQQQQEIVINKWYNGYLDPEYTSRVFPKDTIENLARKMAYGRGIPFIPYGKQVIVVDYHENKYRAFQVPPAGETIALGELQESLDNVVLQALAKAKKLGATVIVTDKLGASHTFDFQEGHASIDPISKEKTMIYDLQAKKSKK